MAELAVQPAPVTFEDAARIDPDREPGDVVMGEWKPLSKNTWLHGKIVFNICLILGAYRRTHPGWSFAAGDPGTKLTRDPDTLRAPDVGVAREEREPSGRGAQGWLDGAPELAIEVLGDDQSMSEVLEKALEYLRAGSQAVWAVDPTAQRVVVVTPPNQFRILGAEESLDGGEVLPEFSCRVSELFE